MSLLTLADAIKQLSRHYNDERLIPFIGAGFSLPLGLPSWEKLVEKLAEKLDFEPELFRLHGTFAQLAEYAKIMDRRLWQDFVTRITREFDSAESIERRKASITHKALASLNLRTIYTTNYDSHIEGALEDAGKKVVTLSSLADFLESQGRDACEVIKFHGTFSDQETIILTESRYFERLSLEDAVDQRLRADILSNSLLFIGYSFNDPNIRYIWYRIDRLRRQQSKEYNIKLRPSYLITFGADPVQPVLLNEWDIHVIPLDPADKNESIANLLSSVRNKGRK